MSASDHPRTLALPKRTDPWEMFSFSSSRPTTYPAQRTRWQAFSIALALLQLQYLAAGANTSLGTSTFPTLALIPFRVQFLCLDVSLRQLLPYQIQPPRPHNSPHHHSNVPSPSNGLPSSPTIRDQEFKTARRPQALSR